MMHFRSVIAFALALVVASPAASAEIKKWRARIGTVISISGKLNPGDDRRFSLLTFGTPKATVVLNSDGGDLLAALTIGRELRSYRYSTVVEQGSICASACALIWVAGTPPRLTGASSIGFHSAFNPKDMDTPSWRGNQLVAEYLTDLGYKPKLVKYATEAMPRDMKWVNFLDARAHGIDFSDKLPDLTRLKKVEPAP